jgi:hypothetical protein
MPVLQLEVRVLIRSEVDKITACNFQVAAESELAVILMAVGWYSKTQSTTLIASSSRLEKCTMS